MKAFIKISPVIFCSLLMAAHLGRAGMFILQIISIILPFILFWKTKISAGIIQFFLILFGMEWIRTMIFYIQIRSISGENWHRLAIILTIVAIFNFASLFVFRYKQVRKLYHLS